MIATKETIKASSHEVISLLNCNMDPSLEYGIKLAVNESLGGNYVFTQEEIKKYNIKTQPLSMDEVFQVTSGQQSIIELLIRFIVGMVTNPGRTLFEGLTGFVQSVVAPQIFIRTVCGKTISLDYDKDETVRHLKSRIQDRENIPVDEQRLVVKGKDLNDHSTLSESNVSAQDTLFLMLRLRGGSAPPAYHIDPSFRDPVYDCDFTNTDDTNASFIRGNKDYTRPVGSKRYAIKVLNRFGDNDWIGCSNQPGEWPVAYHGTKEENVQDILNTSFRAGNGAAYGEGIYCTPDPSTALFYAKPYTYNNVQYKLIFQVRVNPLTLKCVKPRTIDGEYWLFQDGKDLRPYGIAHYKL